MLVNGANGRNLIAERFYLFVSVSDASDKEKYFIELPNKIVERRAALETAYWLQEISKCHFSSVQLGQCQFSEKFSEFLKAFGLNRFFPISSDVFKSYDPVSVDFINSRTNAKELILWDMAGTEDLLNLLVNGRTAQNGQTEGEKTCAAGRIQTIEDVWLTFFSPPATQPGEDGHGYFDKFIQANFNYYLN